MTFLVQVSLNKTLEGNAVVATGSGLNWSVSQIQMTSLLEDARRGVPFENVELRVLSAGQQMSLPKDKLVYGGKGSRLWVDTKPYASSRFTKGYAVVLQDIRYASGDSVGYIVAFPDGRVVTVKTDELLKHCEDARQKGGHFVQNMQYVGFNGSKEAHLKNYEGRTVPVYTVVDQKEEPRKPVQNSTIKTVTRIENVLVVNVPPASVLDSIVMVENADKVTEDSVKTNCDACIALLRRRVYGVLLEHLTAEQERMISNYLKFVEQFPYMTAKYGVEKLIRDVFCGPTYVCSVAFKEKHPDLHNTLITTIKNIENKNKR